MSARIPRRIATKLLDHARAETGREICGVIAARDGVPVDCVPIANVAGDPAHRYRMDPEALIRTLFGMEQAGEELYAIYHSHPASPAAPSAIDLAEAGWPDALYLIVSLNTRGVLEMRGYRIRGGASVEVPLEIE
jgi:[CysO sulfur-carrier protein]-S-L-cysteine hydrolase